ncbi:aminoacyl-tRNA hydrolase [Corynebacterium camporealensis]|uniref:aminoacyl-tRNA hydrolase n=1 Tax=Corynebacterium camporealensis TaxID=161896 RepID=UPI0034CEE69D
MKKFFARLFGSQPEADWLVVGLGNPGQRYANTRHNVGYMGIDKLCDAPLKSLRGINATGANVEIDGQNVLLVRAGTYMNNSGEPVGALAQKTGVPAEKIIVLHDELDLAAHKVRCKKGGNENGHNGLKSLTQYLGTRDYLRVRIGIGRPTKGTPIPDYVLSNVDEGVEPAIDTAAEAVRLIVEKGLAAAQNQIHTK